MRFFVHRSNRTENLVAALVDVLSGTPLADPLDRETVVVEGRGIESWLARQLADRLGVWANSQFPFPRRFLRDCFHASIAADESLSARFEPEALAWTVAARLPQRRTHPAFAPVDAFLAGDGSPALLLSLSQHLARLFDQYVTFRPELVTAWEQGRDDHWQAILWRDLVEHLGRYHIAALAQSFLQHPLAHADRLPQRVCLFGLSTLPRLYIQVLATLAAHTDVHLFLLSPSPHYLGDIRSRRESLRAYFARPDDRADLQVEIDHAGVHPLLASLGTVARDFHFLLEDTCPYQEDDRHADPSADTSTLLRSLHADLFAMNGPDPSRPPTLFTPGDASLRIHRCHSPMREVQVLHDQILGAFEFDPSLGPDDVVVLCPAIDDYAPLVDAVFGARSDGPAIPYRIADRRLRSEQTVVDAFLRILAALDGRVTSAEIADLVELPPVRDRFGIAEADTERVVAWIRDAGIRWGLDEDHRADHDQPPLAENTWRFGLERLFLGYAMAPLGDRAFAGRVPAGEIEGSAASILGGLADLHDALTHLRQITRQERFPADWAEPLGQVLQAFLADDADGQEQRLRIREAITAIVRRAGDAGFSAPLPFATMRRLLEQEIERGAPGRGFASGGITFCALVPMRSVPYRMVCLLGMSDDTFPRRSQPANFDLMAHHPQPGDRSPRSDDRFLFLEAILAARDRLVITHVGRDVRDNGVRPPAVVVSEVLDHIDRNWSCDDDPVSKHLVVDHPLQPFSPRYFDGTTSGLAGYSMSHFAAARQLTTPAAERKPFVFVKDPLVQPILEEPVEDGASIATPAPAVVEPIQSLSADRLVRFLENPARGFLRERLGMTLLSGEAELDTREPIELDHLAMWSIGDDLVERSWRGGDSARAADLFRAEGRLPPGNLGAVVYERVLRAASRISAAAAATCADVPPQSLPFDFVVGGTEIHGELRDVWPIGRVRAHYARLSGKALLDLWIHHLCLNIVQPPDCILESHLFTRATKGTSLEHVRLLPIDNAAEHLSELIEVYRLGMDWPLPLFPKASWKYCESLAKHDEDRARRDARIAYLGGMKSRGDADDPWIRLVFGIDEPLPMDASDPPTEESADDEPAAEGSVFTDLRFEPLARMVFGTVLQFRADGAAESGDAADEDEA